MACAGITVWGGLANAGLKAGETVALVGAGGGLGRADVVIDARMGKEKVIEEVKKVTDQKEVDLALTLRDAPGPAALACATDYQDAWHHDTDCSEHDITVKTNPFYGLKDIPHLVEVSFFLDAQVV
ncbi:MAG: hypothetical protein LQ337_001758 [Flavoplaca oasis]|nr:MAG: hypothetical protein LQ337_001758 [Flavoplaca oasis]